MAGVFAPGRLWTSYMRRLGRHPVQTKACTSIVAAALGDFMAQTLSRPKDTRNWRYDYLRTARLCMFNAGMGCLGHYYYGALDKTVGFTAPTSPQTIITKVAIDQLLFSPLCTLVFYAYKTTVEGRSGDYVRELQQKLWPTLKAGWTLWPAAHVINFAFVPTQHRILYANIVSIAGTFLLSRAAAGDYTHSRKGSAGMPNEVLFDGVTVKLD